MDAAPNVERGRYRAFIAETEDLIAQAQSLRHRAFGLGSADGLDRDSFDATCRHFIVQDVERGDIVCTYRVLHLMNGTEIDRSYSAQFYDVARLHNYDQPMAEMGRFCIDPTVRDADVLRMAWGAMTAYVDRHKVGMLFGCASFRGTDPAIYHDTLAHLRTTSLAPEHHAPLIKSQNAVALPTGDYDKSAALRYMPPLLRTYLIMGGWVSDHAVIDTSMQTFHLFTAVEIAKIPVARQRLLRALA